ncbi:DEDD exonuclease domain-containing protein [Brachybacterium hainanense]|uniref:DEDD exonuclease domain-containing protein n=1 Tax=Brachybacterium hainanense TaxID=1541174 RepID=A0ABV6RG40_9MICO
MSATARRPPRPGGQLSFDDLGTPLPQADLVVVDLETTGTDPSADAITEIGAVRVRGGEVLGEFRTFVDPQRPIPAYIARLTGISDAAVAGAPRIETVLPMFLDFARDAALVAHNARFDIGFLRAQCARIDHGWPDPLVLDTLQLARQVFGRDEVRDHRLGTLAAHVGASVAPDHRALSDARATVDVLHAIIERLGPARAGTLEDLASAHRRLAPVQLRKRHLARDVPTGPGVYQFLGDGDQVLYVGTSRDLRTRVRTYFSASERRRKVLDMLPRAQRVRTIPCASALEAAVRELRIIGAEKPPANRHGLTPEKALWLRLGPGSQGLRGARLATVEEDGIAHIGPLRSRREIEPLRGLLTDAVLGGAVSRDGAGPPSRIGSAHHEALRRAMILDPSPVLEHGTRRMRAFAGAGRYEDAARVRSLLETYLQAAGRAARLRAIRACRLLVAARPHTDPRSSERSWELLAVRGGRFAGAAMVPLAADPLPIAEALARTGTGEAEQVTPLCQGYHQETELILRWLEHEDVRIVLREGSWAVPARARFDLSSLQETYARTH